MKSEVGAQLAKTSTLQPRDGPRSGITGNPEDTQRPPAALPRAPPCCTVGKPSPDSRQPGTACTFATVIAASSRRSMKPAAVALGTAAAPPCLAPEGAPPDPAPARALAASAAWDGRGVAACEAAPGNVPAEAS
eukprot:CAMPEP_0171128956 /NCGR_PEP_ID=MMETSP0766_2-20121228/118082_1 /TAXON_ID=439317 /ORGANISM="Gambierdiscus australes, Strain CAWD 149" /LENGTH=133 /DNA_ID=CAMNT_0011592133 /DNA_START=24 /DNA_END=422 /DNA_ORIENTATION=+